jgi:hypothetical protein
MDVLLCERFIRMKDDSSGGLLVRADLIVRLRYSGSLIMFKSRRASQAEDTG